MAYIVTPELGRIIADHMERYDRTRKIKDLQMVLTHAKEIGKKRNMDLNWDGLDNFIELSIELEAINERIRKDDKNIVTIFSMERPAIEERQQKLKKETGKLFIPIWGNVLSVLGDIETVQKALVRLKGTVGILKR